MNRGISVTGMGIVSSIGWSVEETWSAIEAGRGGLGRLSIFRSPRYGDLPVGQVPGELAARSGLERASRSDHLALLAARQAFEDAGLAGAESSVSEGVGIMIGGCVGGMLDSEVFLERLLESDTAEVELLHSHECASSADVIADRLGLFGPCATVSTACSSGSNAISCACDLIAAGEAEIMLAGGTDSLSRLTINGFGSLLLLDPEGCRPFDRNRKGMSLGEGAAMLVLESSESAAKRKAHVYARVNGWSGTCDAHHVTAPAPDGEGILRAMRAALEQAGLGPPDIHYVNAHGTGTSDNDLAEAAALRELFGRDLPPVSSTKRFFGHTFGAAGAIEAVVCVLALMHQAVPPNPGFQTPDPACGIVPPVRLESARIDQALTLSLGFGGNNGCLVLSRPGTGKALL